MEYNTELSKTEQLKQSELLQLQTNANEEHNNASFEIIHREHVEDTPFTMIMLQEGDCFIACGNYRLTERIGHVKALELIDGKDWNLIMQLIDIVCNYKLNEFIINQKQQNNEY